ncbi:hypothetical protein GCM10026983_04050 [Gracilibacillus alcaliphilus]
MAKEDLQSSYQPQARTATYERNEYTGSYPKEEAVLWKERSLCNLRQPYKQGFCGFQAK